MKLRNPEPHVGFIGFNERDPFVSNLIEDKLWREQEGRQEDRRGEPIRKRLRDSLAKKHIKYDPPEPPLDRTSVAPPVAAGDVEKPAGNESNNGTRELNPRESLEAFLTFCRESYPAKRYMLFILGHGVVVGNDIFLFDENPAMQSLSLQDLGILLNDFKKNLKKGAEFELVSFHSCSVSSFEVAYELQDDKLQGTANYMLASQGPAFVGSWPYRQILMRIFNNVKYQRELEKEGKTEKVKENVKELLRDIFSLCYYNSLDFLLAGYSFDLCLSNLNKVREITDSLRKLAAALREGLANPLLRDFIVLAHWESQSHWQENYTDLRDFCFCLSRKCREFAGTPGKDAESEPWPTRTTLEDIIANCDNVIAQLEEETPGKDEKLIVKSDFAGPGYQYSHGLSVFFPWSRPVTDRPFLEDYRKYKFNETTWLDFLEHYFDTSRRKSQKTEANQAIEAGLVAAPPRRSAAQVAAEELAEDLLSLVFNGAGQLSNEASPADVLKIGTRDPTGDECTCPSIKNYPRDTRDRRLRARAASVGEESVPVSNPVSGDQKFSLLP
ncbi:MAG TPA: clostripain-related cysteine peptidase [Pyrinomonadaceae bacterium]|nr:clostripain-related cysteine peptidase [Pyrinomonadaceae bacterium]